MEYEVLLPIGLILLISKLLSIFCHKIGLPRIVGLLLAGVLIGLINYIPDQTILNEYSLNGIGFIAKIGVILIMFSAGIETDMKTLKQTGFASVMITLAGVIVPMALGFVVAAAFNGGFADMSREQAIQNVFYGVLLTATSVSVTVATLKEMGKLNSKVGTAIVSAAILDDIIGVVILSFVIGISDQGASGAAASPWRVLVMTVLFFVFVIVFGILINKFFKWFTERYPHSRRVPILSFAFCFLLSYVSEKVFGVADITGAFFAGLILSSVKSHDYIDRKVDITTYMIFGPVFFANIGINTSFSGIDGNMVLFGLCFVVVGMVGKFVGCGLAAKFCGFNIRESLTAGVGMMARAEVILVTTNKGIENNIIPSTITPFILIVIIFTSFIVPLFLKVINKDDKSATPPLIEEPKPVE